MARPKGSKNKPKADNGSAGEPASNGGIGHNTAPLTDDDMQALALHHKRAYEAKLAAGQATAH